MAPVQVIITRSIYSPSWYCWSKTNRATDVLARVQTSPLPQKKSGEETIFSEGGGTSVHRGRLYTGFINTHGQ